MRYIASAGFLVHAMAMWWVLWLGLSFTRLNVFVPPSGGAAAQFAGFILFFLIGHAVVSLLNQSTASIVISGGRDIRQTAFALRRSLQVLVWACLGILLVSLYLSGAFSEGFLDYLIKLRGDEATGDSLTGSRLLDVTTKAVVFPISYTLTTVILAVRIGQHRWMLAIGVINI